MSFTDRELFARMLKCEAEGEGDTGMRAVATIIMNRVNASTGEYQRVCLGDIRLVLLQEGQFDCARDIVGGRPNPRSIYSLTPDQIQYDIVDWAFGGGLLNAVGDCLWYLNPFRPSCSQNFPGDSGTFHTRIGNHCFYRPTPYYDNT